MHISRFLITGVIVILCQPLCVFLQTECGVLGIKERLLPWSVNLYRLNNAGIHEFICMGTIISRSVVLTAAHCFYDDLKQQRRPGKYFLTTGPTHSWNGSSKQGSQIRELTSDSVILSKKYKGKINNYSDNIAIIKLANNNNLNLNSAKSVCLDWDNDMVETKFEVPPLRAITWSATKNVTANMVQPTYVIYDKCFDLLEGDFQQYLTFDKMCAQVEGILKTPCTGTGLYAFNKDKNRWYLIGIGSEIVSIGSKTMITFTKISAHLNWLSTNVFLLLDP